MVYFSIIMVVYFSIIIYICATEAISSLEQAAIMSAAAAIVRYLNTFIRL